MKRFGLVAVLLLASHSAFADSITIYSTPPPGATGFPPPILLTGSASQIFRAYTGPGELTATLYFLETFQAPEAISTLTWTFKSPGFLNSPLVITFAPENCTSGQCVLTGSFTVPKYPRGLRFGSLTVDLNGTSKTYDFSYRPIVPEPTSLLVIGHWAGGYWMAEVQGYWESHELAAPTLTGRTSRQRE